MRALLLMIACGAAMAQLPQTPQDVVDFLASSANLLANAHSENSQYPSDAGPFLDRFDTSMPGYPELSGDVQGLVAQSSVSSSIEVVSDEGDARKRTLELDWIVQIPDQPTRRKIVKVTIEKRKKDWKFTRFEPIDLFRPPS
jgi:hypothetical protein